MIKWVPFYVNAALYLINSQFILHFIFKKYELTSLKVGMFQSLRKHLLEELEQAFPEDVEQYREIRASSAAVSGNTIVLI